MNIPIPFLPCIKRRTILAATFAAIMCFNTPAKAVEDSRVFEMRVYVTNEGKLPALLSRFRDHTVGLFKKHGIENIGYWLPVEKNEGAENTLIYVIAHKNREAAAANWEGFRKDPEWQAAAKASEANGKILAQKPEVTFMRATDYSTAIKPSTGSADRIFELRTYTTPEGKLDALNARFRNHTVGLFSRHGMSHIAYWTPTDPEAGASHKLIYILSHASKEAGLRSFESFRADPEWIAAKAKSESEGPLTLAQPEGVKSVYMKATDFSPIR